MDKRLQSYKRKLQRELVRQGRSNNTLNSYWYWTKTFFKSSGKKNVSHVSKSDA